MAISRIMTHFGDLPDPRKPLGRRHVLSDMLVIAICAVICGADGWSQVAAFGRAKHVVRYVPAASARHSQP